MGLDMTLTRKHYIGNKWKNPEEQVKIEVEGIDQARVQEITEEVIYWRKANAIHNWFVENVQDGKDDCDEYYVSHDQLKTLLETVEKVLKSSKLVKGTVTNGYKFTKNGGEPITEQGKIIKDPSVAQTLLPTTSGFFFGGTDYDQYYYEDLKRTALELRKIVTEPIRGDYYYSSSW